MKVMLYSTKCPKCLILEKKLKDKNITYEEINDVETMTNLGFTLVPILEVDGQYMNFNEANKWINEKEECN